MTALREAAGGYGQQTARNRTPLMPLIIDAVRARATVGEISDALRERWGAYRPG
jgi:methylmalonyl-CoA mutase N-terminal domain/subunit